MTKFILHLKIIPVDALVKFATHVSINLGDTDWFWA